MIGFQPARVVTLVHLTAKTTLTFLYHCLVQNKFRKYTFSSAHLINNLRN